MITQKILKRSLVVARRMRHYAEGYTHLNPKDCFIVGLLHDVGHEFSDEECCAEDGGYALQNVGFDYWKEIRWHGNPEAVHCSTMLLLLNYVDMTTDANGNVVTMAKAYGDIVDKYGINSKQAEGYLKLKRQLEKEIGKTID